MFVFYNYWNNVENEHRLISKPLVRLIDRLEVVRSFKLIQKYTAKDQQTGQSTKEQ